MALAETAKLIAQLSLDDRMSAGLKKAGSNIGRFEGSLNRAGQGVRTAAGNIAKFGVVAGAGIALAVRSGIANLATLESAVTSVDGAIKQMGLTGQVTGAQIAGWANEIEASVGAAFDDKDITAATATLIRFGGITKSNIRPAMQIITDLAVKTGDVGSAATLLGKALADPEKAAGKLARTGVILTKAQQKQIVAFVKAGKIGKAQKVILDSLAKTTAGAAAASQGPYARAMSVLGDVTEDAQKALAEGFLPVLEKVAGLLSGELAKPSTINAIRSFGQDLAAGLDDLIDIGQKLPWGVIGESLKTAGAGAKTILGAFTSLPAWVQTAVITGWGLNKLTGGALGDIAGSLGSGLIKGVLGMTAGVVNIKAGTVVGGGGVTGGGTPATKGGGGGAATVAKVFLAGIAAGVAVELAQELGKQSTEIQKQGGDLVTQAKGQAPGLSEADTRAALQAIADQGSGLNAIALGLTNTFNHGLDNLAATEKILQSHLLTIQQQKDTAAAVDFRAGEKAPVTDDATKDAIVSAGDTFDRATGLAKTANVAALATVGGQVTSGSMSITGAVGMMGSRVVGALATMPPPVVNVSVNTNVTASDVVKTTVSKDRQGPPPSRNGGQTWGGGQ